MKHSEQQQGDTESESEHGTKHSKEEQADTESESEDGTKHSNFKKILILIYMVCKILQ